MEYQSGTEVTLPIPEYASHTFQGWYLNDSYTGNPVTKVTMTNDVTVYAKWSA